jgi:hypothetical protein
MPKDGKRAKGSNFLSSTDRGRSHDVNRDQEGKGHSQTIGHRWRDNSGYQEKAREEDGVTTLHCKSIFFEPLRSRTTARDRPLPKIESSNSGGMHGKWRARLLAPLLAQGLLRLARLPSRPSRQCQSASSIASTCSLMTDAAATGPPPCLAHVTFE